MEDKNPLNEEQVKQNAQRAMQRRAKKKGSNWGHYAAIGAVAVICAAVLALLIVSPERSPSQIPVIQEDLIEQHNATNQLYQQGPNEQFKGYSLADAKKLMRATISQQAKMISPCETYMQTAEIVPVAYDIRTKFQECIEPVISQGNCSSSIAIASASMLSERFCIQSKGKEIVSLSSQDIISCNARSRQCEGGDLDGIWNSIRDNGIVTEKCFPYTSHNGTSPQCDDRCKDTSKDNIKQITTFCVTGQADAIKREVFKNGPIVSAMVVFTDFLTYKTGIYYPLQTSSKFQGGHVVSIIGWGQEEGVDYWIVKNSWGADWGEDGYAKVKVGEKQLLLEEFAIAATPLLPDTTVSSPESEVEDLDNQQKTEETQTQETQTEEPVYEEK